MNDPILIFTRVPLLQLIWSPCYYCLVASRRRKECCDQDAEPKAHTVKQQDEYEKMAKADPIPRQRQGKLCKNDYEEGLNLR